LNINPLRDLVRRHVDFGALREMEDLKLFVAATNVRTGHHRLFRNAELDVEAVMASACLPVLFRAVEIDGEPYWDGGYTSNPALLPLIAESQPVDLILVQLNPVVRQGVPQQAHEIIDRMNEISFNSSLNQELRTLGLIKELLQQESASGNDYREPLFQRIDAVNIHRIAARKELASFGASSKMNARWAFLELLHDLGYRAAGDWLAEHFDDLGRRSTLHLGGHALDPADEP
jgi:NTE family protein